MTKAVHAIHEHGVFRPIEPVNLPDRCEVEFEVRVVKEESPKSSMSEGLMKIYSILGERYNSGQTDTAARHDEHQP